MRLGINGWRIHGQRTGAGRYLLNIVQHWDADTVNGSFDEVSFYSPQKINRQEIPLPANIRERVLAQKSPMLVWENTRFGPAANDDVLFCPSYSRPLVVRGKVVVTIFEATLKLYPELFPRSSWYSRPEFYLRLYQWSAHHSIFVITSTEAAKQDIMKAYGVPEKKIRVVYLAPPEMFRQVKDDQKLADMRRKILGEDVPYFLFVGKMTPRRNVPKLMQAFAQLKKQTKLPHRLVLVGKNTTGLALASYAQELGITREMIHLEFVSDDDLVLLYNAAEAFILPHTYEAVSLTALEAQATGLPVIIMDVPGMRETTGDVALYMKHAEVPDMVGALKAIATDASLRRDLSLRGLKFASQFSWRRTAAETLNVLQEAANA
jgi:glycosyltransferase involved in cell wall biosynthesis